MPKIAFQPWPSLRVGDPWHSPALIEPMWWQEDGFTVAATANCSEAAQEVAAYLLLPNEDEDGGYVDVSIGVVTARGANDTRLYAQWNSRRWVAEAPRVELHIEVVEPFAAGERTIRVTELHQADEQQGIGVSERFFRLEDQTLTLLAELETVDQANETIIQSYRAGFLDEPRPQRFQTVTEDGPTSYAFDRQHGRFGVVSTKRR